MEYSYEIWNDGKKWDDTYSRTVIFNGTELEFRKHLDNLRLGWQYTKNIKSADGAKIERLTLNTMALSYVDSMPEASKDKTLESRREMLFEQYQAAKTDISFADFVIKRLIETEEI